VQYPYPYPESSALVGVLGIGVSYVVGLPMNGGIAERDLFVVVGRICEHLDMLVLMIALQLFCLGL